MSSISVPIAGQVVSVSTFGTPVVNALNAITDGTNLVTAGSATVGGIGTFTGNVTAPNLPRGPLVDAAITAMSASIAATLTVVITTASATFKAGRAYRIELEGGIQPAAANIEIDIRIFKGTTTATPLGEYFRVNCGALGLAYQAYAYRTVKIGASDVTTAVCVAISASSSTAQMFGSATAPSILRVVDVGPATAFTTAVTLS